MIQPDDYVPHQRNGNAGKAITRQWKLSKQTVVYTIIFVDAEQNPLNPRNGIRPNGPLAVSMPA